jgi:uncharacterized protein YjbI with pentapeptide repeats
MNRVSRSVVAVCAVASLLVTGAEVSPVSAKTVNGCVIKAKTKCLKADLKGANLKGANLKGANLTNTNLTNTNLTGADLKNVDLATNLTGADLTGVTWSNTTCPGSVTNTGCDVPVLRS